MSSQDDAAPERHQGSEMDRELTTAATSVLLGLSAGSLACAGEIPDARVALEKWSEALGIERPWDDLPELPDSSRRHRGALAHVRRQLRGGRIPEEAIANFYRDLGSLLILKEAEHVLECRPQFSNYRQFFKIDTFLLWKQLITGSPAPLRWNSIFKEVYYSQADGAGVLFNVRMPPAVKDRAAYPLLVALGRGPQVNPDHRFPFIQVGPSRGGIWGYRSISAYDVMQVITFMKRHYPVDADRVYLAGFSAGASGAMHLASCYPDEFAAILPMVAVGNDYPLVNFKNLPVAVHHGTDDWTSSICNARVQYEKMQRLGCPVTLKEYPNTGHAVPGSHEALVRWLLGHSRNRSPLSVTHECETPALGRSYWVHIREFGDPHQRASMEASVAFTGERGKVNVQPRNVRAFTIDLDLMPAGGARIETVDIQENRLAIEGAPKHLECRFQQGRWQVAPDEEPADPLRRPYHAGAAANLYQGEPLLVVYGTGNARAERLRSAARKLAACGGPAFASMRGRFPVVRDDALSSEQEANCNLILIGTPAENRVTNSLLPDLPVAVKNDALVAADRPALQLKNQVLSLLYPNPRHPKRLVYLVAPFVDDGGLARFCESPQRFLVGSDGFDRVSQADLAVQNLDCQIARQMQFGKGWDWLVLPGSDTKIPPRFRDRAELAITYLELMRRKTGADFAFWWGPADRGMWGYDFNYLKRYNPDLYTQADFRTQHHLAETMTGSVPGVELRDIWNRWGVNKELLCDPELQMHAVDDQKQYRVNIPMDLYIKLGQRRKALANPKPGPAISSGEVMAEIFQRGPRDRD